MSEFLKKNFLDFEGLSAYDELIKAYVDDKSNSGGTALQEEVERAKEAEQAILDALAAYQEEQGTNQEEINSAIAENKEAIEANATAIETLNGDANVEGSVANQVKTAVDNIIDNAPDIYDTLKEIADWIENDETGAASLAQSIAENKEAIETNAEAIEAVDQKVDEVKEEAKTEVESLKAYVDTQDKAVYESFGSITEVSINSLFKTKVNVQEGHTVAEALSVLKDNEMLVLPENSTVAEDLVIGDNVVIDANGSTFTGTIAISSNSNAVIENAVFVNPVIVMEA